MGMDFTKLTPHKIEGGLAGRTVLVYGSPKAGKTTLACSFPSPILLAAEKGYGLIDGVHVQDINSWSDMKEALRELRKPAVQELFKTVIIDTVPIVWDYCEKYIVSSNGVSAISDIPWGQGWAKLKKEFDNTIREITKLGYGLVLISHYKEYEVKINGESYTAIKPDMPGKCSEICNGIVDIIGYVGIEWNEKHQAERYLYTRSTELLFAGSRLKYLAPKIKFGYKELEKAINDALAEAKEKDGAAISDALIPTNNAPVLDYDSIRAEAVQLWKELVGSGENANEEMAKTILEKAKKIFDRPVKLSEITPEQVEPFNILVIEMRELANKH